MRQGWATSATLMVPCPWAFEAVSQAAGLDIGVHLTLTAEYPGYRWRSLTGGASLHDADGFMPATAEAVFANADITEVRAECRAQIDQALAWGVDVTHLDSHMGTVQTDARFYDVYAQLAAEYDTAGRKPLFEALQPHLSRASGRPGYTRLGESLGMSEGAVTVAVHRMRRRYGELDRRVGRGGEREKSIGWV